MPLGGRQLRPWDKPMCQKKAARGWLVISFWLTLFWHDSLNGNYSQELVDFETLKYKRIHGICSDWLAVAALVGHVNTIPFLHFYSGRLCDSSLITSVTNPIRNAYDLIGQSCLHWHCHSLVGNERDFKLVDSVWRSNEGAIAGESLSFVYPDFVEGDDTLLTDVITGRRPASTRARRIFCSNRFKYYLLLSHFNGSKIRLNARIWR